MAQIALNLLKPRTHTTNRNIAHFPPVYRNHHHHRANLSRFGQVEGRIPYRPRSQSNWKLIDCSTGKAHPTAPAAAGTLEAGWMRWSWLINQFLGRRRLGSGNGSTKRRREAWRLAIMDTAPAAWSQMRTSQKLCRIVFNQHGPQYVKRNANPNQITKTNFKSAGLNSERMTMYCDI